MKSTRGALSKIIPAAAWPAFIPNLFQESPLWGESLQGEGEKKNMENKTGGWVLLPAFVCVCTGCVVFVPVRAI